MKKLSFLCLFLIQSIGLTAPPTVEVPSEIKGQPGQFIFINPKTNAKAISWDSCDTKLSTFPSEALKDPKTTVVIALEKGTFTVKGTAILDNEFTNFSVKIVIGDGINPNPPVPPGPIPPDPPTPVPPVVTPDAWFIVVEETQVRTPQIAAALDFKVWDKYPINGRYRFYDKDSASAKQFKYDVLAANAIDKASKETPPRVISYPVMMAVDTKGNLIKAWSLPLSQTERLDRIKEITGK